MTRPKAPKSRLLNVVVKEVSLLPEGDNPPARVVLYKRQPTPPAPPTLRERFAKAVAAVQKVLGHEPGDEMRKRLYDEVRERQRTSQVYDALMARLGALSESLEGLIWYPSEQEQSADLESLIRASVKQFADSIEKDAADLLSGRIAKALAPLRESSAPPPAGELEARLRSHFEKVLTPGAGAPDEPTAGPETRTTEVTQMKDFAGILAALPDAERALVEKHVAEQVAKAKAEGTSEPAEPTDPLAALPVELRKQLQSEREARDAENVALRKRLETLEQDRSRAAFEKRCQFKQLSVPTAELVDALHPLPEETREKVLKVLGAANAQLEQGSHLFAPLGTELNGPGTAAAELDERAAQVRKERPTLTAEQARAAVITADPELYERLNAEGSARLHH